MKKLVLLIVRFGASVPVPAAGKDNKPSLTPDVILVPAWEDIAEGTDPCAAWIQKNYMQP